VKGGGLKINVSENAFKAGHVSVYWVSLRFKLTSILINIPPVLQIIFSNTAFLFDPLD